MSIQLIQHLNGNNKGLFRQFISKLNRPPSLAWYPAAGRDFTPLLLLSAPYAEEHGLTGSVQAEPDLFLFTDYYSYGSFYSEPGTVLYRDASTKMTIESIEELPELDIPFYTQLITYPTDQYLHRVFFMHVRVMSAEYGSFFCPVIYAFAENAAFCSEVLLAKRASIQQVIFKSWGRGLGGGNSYGAWLINNLNRLGCELMVSWRESDELYRDWDDACNEVGLLFPALVGRNVPEFKYLHTTEDSSGSSMYWYDTKKAVTPMNTHSREYTPLSTQEKLGLERDYVIYRIQNSKHIESDFYATLPEVLKADHLIIEMIIRRMYNGHESLYHQLPIEVKSNKTCVKRFIEFIKPSVLLRFIMSLDPALRDDHDIIFSARARFDKSPESVGYLYEFLDGINPDLWMDVVFIQGLLERCGNFHTTRLIDRIHPDLFRQHHHLVHIILKRGWSNLRYFMQDLRDCKDVVIEAVRHNGNALQYVSTNLQDNDEVVLAAVERNGEALRYASDRLKACREVVLAALNENGNALKYVAGGLKKDHECVQIAIGRNRGAIRYAEY